MYSGINIDKLKTDGFKYICIGIGAEKGNHLQLEGKNDNVLESLDFLRSYINSPETLNIGKNIAVIGGGSTSLDCAETALKLGADDFYLIYRRSFNQMPAFREEKMSALKVGVHFILLNQPKEFITGSDGKLKGLKMVRTRLGEPDQSNRRRPVEISGSEWILDLDIIIEAIGTKPEEDSPLWYPNINLKNNNKVDADPETGITSVEGIFAGGDIISGPELVIKAVQDGKNSAGAISDYLKKKENLR